jgi:hypothetical protein
LLDGRMRHAWQHRKEESFTSEKIKKITENSPSMWSIL